MFAGKIQNSANRVTKRPMFVVLFCLLFVFSLAGFTFSSPANLQPVQPELFIMTRNVQTYDLDATQWNFPMLLAGFGPGPGTARLVEFSIDGHDLLPLVPEAQRTLTVLRLDNEINQDVLRQWDNHRKRAAILRVRNDERISFSSTEEREFREGSSRVQEVMRRRGEIVPVTFVFSVSELPFQVSADGHYRVRAAVKRGQANTAWEGEILIADVEPLATNPFWTPADLHIHSTFGCPSGVNRPEQLAPLLAGKGYRIGYVTDETAGWNMSASTIPPTMGSSGWHGLGAPRATWEQYRTTVQNASTLQVAMFPGAEISASNVNQTYTDHYGHALAYGIQNLVGPGATSTFGTTGLRYCWFTPNTLLSNINSNRVGESSASIAHPVDHQIPLIRPHVWRNWSPPEGNLTTRYDGFELMSAGQTDFSPNSTIVDRWRREIVARLGSASASNGFPSARTGSDWGNHWFTDLATDISYYTFIGLPSPLPSDMRNLPQLDVDRALRNGRTVASRLGGLAVLRLRNAQGGWQEIGSLFTMPANVMVGGEIVLRAARSGNYRVRIIENSSGNIGLNISRHDSTRHLTAGQTVTIPVGFSFLGGLRAYHVIVEHSSISANDTIYTSPIFIRQ